jgi:hypothetical protein
MKKLILVIGVLAITYTLLFAGIPPKAVQKAFDEKFTHAKKVSWNKEPTKGWEAVFTQKGYKFYVNFTEEGAWLVTEKEIKICNLPKTVSNAVKSQYPGWTITRAQNNESTSIGTIYETKLAKGVETKDVAFNEDGSAINR